MGWVVNSNPRAVWTFAENLASHRDSIPGPSSPQRVAKQTELSWPCHEALERDEGRVFEARLAIDMFQ